MRQISLYNKVRLRLFSFSLSRELCLHGLSRPLIILVSPHFLPVNHHHQFADLIHLSIHPSIVTTHSVVYNRKRIFFLAFPRDFIIWNDLASSDPIFVHNSPFFIFLPENQCISTNRLIIVSSSSSQFVYMSRPGLYWLLVYLSTLYVGMCICPPSRTENCGRITNPVVVFSAPLASIQLITPLLRTHLLQTITSHHPATP